MAAGNYPSVNGRKALLDAILECGQDRARRDSSTERSGVVNFLGSNSITIIVVSITDKLKANGFEIVRIGTKSKPNNVRKTGENKNGK